MTTGDDIKVLYNQYKLTGNGTEDRNEKPILNILKE